MKVIAKITDRKVLCEVSADEIALLNGCPFPFNKEWKSSWTDVGTEHELHRAFKALDARREFELKNVRARMDQMSNQFQEIQDAYQKLMLFDNLKNTGVEP